MEDCAVSVPAVGPSLRTTYGAEMKDCAVSGVRWFHAFEIHVWEEVGGLHTTWGAGAVVPSAVEKKGDGGIQSGAVVPSF